jgi:hypothetical protein
VIGRRGVVLSGAALVACGPARAEGGHAMIAATDVDWTYLADTVMGGVSRGGARLEDGALHLSGEVSTENRGGFIQARTDVSNVPVTARGLVIRVRGNGEPYFIHLRTRRTRLPWQYYQARFETGAPWREVTLPWSAFAPSGRLLPPSPDPGEVRSVGLVAYGRDHRADVWLAAFGWA